MKRIEEEQRRRERLEEERRQREEEALRIAEDEAKKDELEEAQRYVPVCTYVLQFSSQEHVPSGLLTVNWTDRCLF